MTLLLLFKGAGTPYAPPVSTYGYTQPKDVVVRLQVLDGEWETCGAGRGRGIVPANVQLTSDQWGSKTASFELRRDPKALWPDIGAFAPVEIEVGGRLVWSGRVSETPVRDSTDSVINVQCEGWQAHLDDDLYEQTYVHTNLADYKDLRSSPATILGVAAAYAAGQTTTQGGGLVISMPASNALSNNAYVGVVLDFGPDSLAKRVVVTFLSSNNSGEVLFFARGSDSGDNLSWGGTSFQDISSSYNNNGSTQTISGTLTTARRYVHFFAVYAGGGATPSADIWFKVISAQAFSSTAYESGGASILKASDVIKDALNRATIKFSSDQSDISTGTFNIPEFGASEPRTPREMWNAVNVFEDFMSKIDVNRRPIFKAKPTVPEVEVGAWSGMEFEDSSSNNGEDIYSRVVITGTQPNGMPLRVYRTQAQLESAKSTKTERINDTSGGIGTYATSRIGSIPVVGSDTSFDTGTSGWTATNSSITRDKSTFDSSPASGRWDFSGSSNPLTLLSRLTTSINGTFYAGVTYRMVFAIRPGTFTGSGPAIFDIQFGTSTDYGKASLYISSASSSFSQVSIDYTPAQTVTSGVSLRLFSRGDPITQAATTYLWIDSPRLELASTTIVERRGFLRTKQVATNFMLTTQAAQQIADKWLLSHRTSPFKGRARLTGNNACREVKTGRPIAPESLLLRTGELMRFTDRIDPDNGAMGRDGRIVEVQYDANTDSAQITIDSSRAGFEALLQRLGIVLGQNRFS